MRSFLLISLLYSAANAAPPVPFFSRSQTANQDAGAMNANLRDITGSNRDNLVPVVNDLACKSGQSLTGATQKGGYIFGGACSNTPTTDGVNVFTATNTFNLGITFSDGSVLFNETSTRTTSGFGTLSQTTFGVSVATASITTHGGEVTCWFTGAAWSTSDNRHIALNIEEDGAFVSPYTATAGVQSAYVCTGCNNHPQPISFHKIFRAPAAGVHNYSLTPATKTNGDFVFDTVDSKPEFGCAESR